MKNPQLLLESPRLEELQEILLTALSEAGFKPGDDFHIIPLEASTDGPLTDEKRFYLDEMAKLNNDLANMQRTLAKTNVELENLAEIRNRFVGMAAHDLRNPLGIIRSFSEYLKTELKSKIASEQMEIIDTIFSTSVFMQRLIDGILDLSAMQSGKVSLSLQRVDLNELFIKNLNLNRILANQHNIEISCTGPSKILYAEIDATKINQVLNNLIANAIKYSNDGSKIECHLYDEDRKAVFCVKDEGIGISPEDQRRIFEPFHRVSSDNKRGKSVGLGLSIAHNIIDAHKGSFMVQSEEGKGSTFCFSLPISPDKSQSS